MSAEKNITLVRRYFEESINQGNLALIDELFAPNYREYIASSIHEPGRERLKKALRSMRQTMPDLHIQIDAIIATADNVEVYATSRATVHDQRAATAHTPHERIMRMLERHVLQIENGQIVAHWRATPSKIETWNQSSGWMQLIR